jgi:DNA processing protein
VSVACTQCARRAWLLQRLGPRLDSRARGLSRFWRLLELPDEELIEAIGGRSRCDLRREYAQWDPPRAQMKDPDVQILCRHHCAFPRGLREDALAPHALGVRGSVERLHGMLDEKLVAIVGTRRASDYGMEVASGLARALARSGLTVASALGEGIPSAAHAGALEADGTTLTVMTGGLVRCTPAVCAPLYRRIVASGCAIAELGPNPRARRWAQLAGARTLALLAQLVIVVEADEHPWELACAQVAHARGKAVAAVPGRVSSPVSRGTNALLMDGAKLVRGPQDALDVLYGVGVRKTSDPARELMALQAPLAEVLERVGSGQDTIAKLAAHGVETGELAVTLAELELRGLLVRGDGGRYLQCSTVPTG